MNAHHPVVSHLIFLAAMAACGGSYQTALPAPITPPASALITGNEGSDPSSAEPAIISGQLNEGALPVIDELSGAIAGVHMVIVDGQPGWYRACPGTSPYCAQTFCELVIPQSSIDGGIENLTIMDSSCSGSYMTRVERRIAYSCDPGVLCRAGIFTDVLTEQERSDLSLLEAKSYDLLLRDAHQQASVKNPGILALYEWETIMGDLFRR